MGVRGGRQGRRKRLTDNNVLSRWLFPICIITVSVIFAFAIYEIRCSQQLLQRSALGTVVETPSPVASSWHAAAIFDLIFCVFASIGLAGGGLAWLVWQNAEASVAAKQLLLLVVIIFALLPEWWLFRSGQLYSWSFRVALVVHLWGYVDAVLRLPVLHIPLSFFAVKQFLLYIARLLILIFGFRHLNEYVYWCTALIIIHAAVLPVLYALMLAEDIDASEQQNVAHNLVHEDVLLRLARIVLSTQYRREIAVAMRKWGVVLVLRAATRSPILASFALCMIPGFRQVLRDAQKRGV